MDTIMAGLEKLEEPETAGGLRWLITYADMITLLLGVFIILVSEASRAEEGYAEMVQAFERTFSILKGGEKSILGKGGRGIMDAATSVTGIKSPPSKTALVKQQFIQTFRVDVEQGEDKVKVAQTKRGLVVRFSDTILFDPGTARIRSESIPALNKIAEFLQGMDNYVSIEGHTDAIPVKSRQFRSNWELSTARAVEVIHFFCDYAKRSGMGADELYRYQKRLSAAGYAQFHLLYPDEPNSPQNRRVDIVILESKTPKDDLIFKKEEETEVE